MGRTEDQALRADVIWRSRPASDARRVRTAAASSRSTGTVISQPMAEMRAQRGAIDKLPEEDPLRVRFNNLHRISVMLMGVNMLAAIAVISLEQVREARKNTPNA